MIKASQFSLKFRSQLDDSINQFQIPKEHEKSKVWFLSGDMTKYGNKDIKMPDTGYEIVRQQIQDQHSFFISPPNGTLDARKSVAKHLSGQNYCLQPDDIILTHGANMGLFNMLISICQHGDNILIPEPSYPFYQQISKAFGVDAIPYKLLPSQQWQIDLQYLESLINEQTKYIWVVNPSNPCASIFSENHQKDIINLAKKYNKIIVSDEVYWNESFENESFCSFGHLADENFSIIVIGGMEKSFLVPGWCVSWMLFFDKNKSLKQIKNSCLSSTILVNPPPSYLQCALPKILDHFTLNFAKKMMPFFEQNFNMLFKELQKIQGFHPIKSQGTFYISVLIDLEQTFKCFKNDIEFLQKLLDEENIWILALSCFGGGVNGFRMMCVAQQDYYDEFFKRLIPFCQKYANLHQ